MQLGRYQPSWREMGAYLTVGVLQTEILPPHAAGAISGQPRRNMSHHHWCECKDMAAWLGYRCNFGCWCPQRHSCSWKCPHDWLQVQQGPWLLPGTSRRVRYQSCLHVHAHAMSSQQWIKGLTNTCRAWTPSVVHCDVSSRGCPAQPDLILLPMLLCEGWKCNAEPAVGLPAWPEHSDLKTSFFPCETVKFQHVLSKNTL